MPDPNDPSAPDPDSLAGSPELFATNLLLVRAIDNKIERIVIERQSDKITVQLIHPDRDYEPETLTEDTARWNDIVGRFEENTAPDREVSGEGTLLEPSIPSSKSVDEIRLINRDNQLEIILDY